MKCRVFLRVAKTKSSKGYRVAASTRPNDSPIRNDAWSKPDFFPTVAFAVDLDIPESAFKRAEQVVAALEVPDDAVEVAASVGSE